mmetsp:Transcript_20095/g.65465  ORF Transcript_20095/g.65465 Transcript_20095/m.65465 type:complete len:135 (-) Transcript_20095:954-1358(-)
MRAVCLGRLTPAALLLMLMLLGAVNGAAARAKSSLASPETLKAVGESAARRSTVMGEARARVETARMVAEVSKGVESVAESGLAAEQGAVTGEEFRMEVLYLSLAAMGAGVGGLVAYFIVVRRALSSLLFDRYD